MICDHSLKITIRSLGPWPEDTLCHAYPEAGIRLTHTSTGFGGKRVWFLCPHCNRRCGVLYSIPANGFICRICSNGRYASEVESPIDRLYRKARKLRCKLGQPDPDMMLPFPAKPTGMHWSTYLRLRRQGLAIETRLIDYMRANLPEPSRRRVLDQSIKAHAELA